MTHTVWLLPEESTLLQLSPNVQYTLHVEELQYTESLTKKIARQTLFAPQNATLQSIFTRLMHATSSQAALQIVEEIDMRSLSFHDQREIWYTAGPDVLTTIIGQLLPSVQNDDDLEFLSSLTIIRHTLFGLHSAS